MQSRGRSSCQMGRGHVPRREADHHHHFVAQTGAGRPRRAPVFCKRPRRWHCMPPRRFPITRWRTGTESTSLKLDKTLSHSQAGGRPGLRSWATQVLRTERAGATPGTLRFLQGLGRSRKCGLPSSQTQGKTWWQPLGEPGFCACGNQSASCVCVGVGGGGGRGV